MDIVFLIEETIPGSQLDELLRREQARAVVELIAAYTGTLSRVHSALPPPGSEKPRR